MYDSIADDTQSLDAIPEALTKEDVGRRHFARVLVHQKVLVHFETGEPNGHLGHDTGHDCAESLVQPEWGFFCDDGATCGDEPALFALSSVRICNKSAVNLVQGLRREHAAAEEGLARVEASPRRRAFRRRRGGDGLHDIVKTHACLATSTQLHANSASGTKEPEDGAVSPARSGAVLRRYSLDGIKRICAYLDQHFVSNAAQALHHSHTREQAHGTRALPRGRHHLRRANVHQWASFS